MNEVEIRSLKVWRCDEKKRTEYGEAYYVECCAREGGGSGCLVTCPVRFLPFLCCVYTVCPGTAWEDLRSVDILDGSRRGWVAKATITGASTSTELQEEERAEVANCPFGAAVYGYFRAEHTCAQVSAQVFALPENDIIIVQLRVKSERAPMNQTFELVAEELRQNIEFSTACRQQKSCRVANRQRPVANRWVLGHCRP